MCIYQNFREIEDTARLLLSQNVHVFRIRDQKFAITITPNEMVQAQARIEGMFDPNKIFKHP